MYSFKGWLRLAVIGVCCAAIGLSGACKQTNSKSNSGSQKNTSEKKKTGTKEKEGGDKKGGGKKGGGKQGGGKKGGGKKGSGKKGGGKKSAGKSSGKSAGSAAKKQNGKAAKGDDANSEAEKPAKGEKPEGKPSREGRSKREVSATSAPKPLEGIAFTVPSDWKVGKAEKEVAALRGCYEISSSSDAGSKAIVLIHHQPDAKDKAKETLTKFFAKVKPAGGAKEATPAFTDFSTEDGIKITVGDITGVVSRDSGSEGAKDTEVRIIAAVIEDAKGPHTVRVTGPKAIVDGAADSFMAFVRSVKPQA